MLDGAKQQETVTLTSEYLLRLSWVSATFGYLRRRRGLEGERKKSDCGTTPRCRRLDWAHPLVLTLLTDPPPPCPFLKGKDGLANTPSYPSQLPLLASAFHPRKNIEATSFPARAPAGFPPHAGQLARLRPGGPSVLAFRLSSSHRICLPSSPIRPFPSVERRTEGVALGREEASDGPLELGAGPVGRRRSSAAVKEGRSGRREGCERGEG